MAIGDRDITALAPERRRVGIQFQDDLLFPHLSVGDNLAFALAPHVRDRAARRDARRCRRSREADLAGFADRDPATLSGGQRARVALMRTLLSEPQVLLLDEPFNKLDAQLRNDVRRFVFGHAAERGLPMLLVTHDAADAQAAGGRVMELARVLNRGRVPRPSPLALPAPRGHRRAGAEHLALRRLRHRQRDRDAASGARW